MSHFYATIPTSARKTVPTARGHKSTGVSLIGASWRGAIRLDLSHNDDTGLDEFQVTMMPWHGAGDFAILAKGTVGDVREVEFPKTAFTDKD
jgi:hypothetical protein